MSDTDHRPTRPLPPRACPGGVMLQPGNDAEALLELTVAEIVRRIPRSF